MGLFNATNRRSVIGGTPRDRAQSLYLLAGCLLLVAATGCESWQKKFIRKSKKSKTAYTPIINFEDYSHAMTPLDRYRKHDLLFDYWNAELLAALQEKNMNSKRCIRASEEALTELRTMSSLLGEERAARLAPLIDERARAHNELTSGLLDGQRANRTWHVLEEQTRRLHREFSWREVQDQLKQ